MLHEDWCALPRHLGRADERRGPGVGLIVEAVVTSKTAVTRSMMINKMRGAS